MIPALGEIPTVLDKVKGILIAAKDLSNAVREIVNVLVKSGSPSESDNKVMAQALRSLSSRVQPTIALVGQTSTGKSTFVNALFGENVSSVSLVPDHTRAIIRVAFPSGMVLYDSPGLFGDQQLENITRAFLGLPQRGDAALRCDTIPISYASTEQKEYLPAKYNRRLLRSSLACPSTKIDMVLWTVKINETPTRHTTDAHRALLADLKTHFAGRIVVAGTHLDELHQKDLEEEREMVKRWGDATSEEIIPVSSVTEENLDTVVEALFRCLPSDVPLAILQESLKDSRKLKRLRFVITEASKVISEIAFRTGGEKEEIHLLVIILFIQIINHYSVDESKWNELNGDAQALASAIQEQGERVEQIPRTPTNFWEWLQTILGSPLVGEIRHNQPVGYRGIGKLLPEVLKRIVEFGVDPAKKCAIDDILNRSQTLLAQCQPQIEAAVTEENKAEVLRIVDSTMQSALSGCLE